MIAIIDYGVGNIFSLTASLKHLGKDFIITNDENVIRNAHRIILPGVGAFGDAIKKLESTGLIPVIKECAKEKPIMGICLGMQLLFEKSYEYGCHTGLGFLKGEIVPLNDNIKEDLKIPHMGWNALKTTKSDCPILKYTNENDYVYYVHSYCAVGCEESLSAYSDYSFPVTGVVWKNNIFGTQFHPEKSGDVGLNILKAFTEI